MRVNYYAQRDDTEPIAHYQDDTFTITPLGHQQGYSTHNGMLYGPEGKTGNVWLEPDNIVWLNRDDTPTGPHDA